MHVGLENGVVLRTVVDIVTGVLSDSRSRVLGTTQVLQAKLKMAGSDAIVMMSNKPWLCYLHMERIQMTPLSYEHLDQANSFSSSKCPEGLVAIAGSTLRIITVERLGESFTQTVLPLLYTPIKIQVHPQTNFLVVL